MYQFSNFQRAEIGPPQYPRLKDGYEGICLVEKTFIEDTRFGPALIVEMTVMTSNHPENQAGERVVWKQDLTKKDVCDNAMLQFAAGVLGVNRDDENSVNALKQQMQALMNYAVFQNPENNNFTKRYVCIRAREIQTKNSGRDFTVYDFYPYVQNGS